MSHSQEQLELLSHLEAKKTQMEEWIAEDPTNRWGGYPTNDLDHWASMGVTSVAQYERYNLEATVWDMYKEVHGFRPRWMNMSTMSIEELQETVERLSLEAQEVAKREAEMEAHAVEKFESVITQYIGMGATDRKTAIRWFMDANSNTDNRDLEFDLNLPLGYIDRQFS